MFRYLPVCVNCCHYSLMSEMNVLLQVWTGSTCFPQRRSKSGMECRANSGELANTPWPWANIYNVTHWAPRSCVILTVPCTMSLNRSALSDWWEVWLRCYSVTCQVGNTCFCQTVLSIIRADIMISLSLKAATFTWRHH